jgi:secreted PhoX family phosphatase
MHDIDEISSNPTDNPRLSDLIDARIGRRAVVGGGLAAAAASFLGCGSTATDVRTATAGTTGVAATGRSWASPRSPSAPPTRSSCPTATPPRS